MTPEEAVAWADKQIHGIYKKWWRDRSQSPIWAKPSFSELFGGQRAAGARRPPATWLRICLIRTIASSTACSGLMPSVTMRWIAFAQTRSL